MLAVVCVSIKSPQELLDLLIKPNKPRPKSGFLPIAIVMPLSRFDGNQQLFDSFQWDLFDFDNKPAFISTQQNVEQSNKEMWATNDLDLNEQLNIQLYIMYKA